MLKTSLLLISLGWLATPLSIALEPNEISPAAKESTVRVDGQSPGSGVIYKKTGNRYYVLTAQHVVATPDEYEIITDDEQSYPLDFNKVYPVPETDLVIAEFTSDSSYPLAELGDSDQVTEGDPIFISGWPHVGEAIPYIYQFISNSISGIALRPLPGGYGLVYTGSARKGLSGGPLFNTEGAVIGIHGLAEGKELFIPESNFDSVTVRDGFSLGVPINVFLTKTLAPKASEPVSVPLSVIQPDVSPSVAQAVQARSRDRAVFARPPRLNRRVRIPNNTQFRASEYQFTIDIPAEAGGTATTGCVYPNRRGRFS